MSAEKRVDSGYTTPSTSTSTQESAPPVAPQPQPTFYSHRFWDSEPSLVQARNTYIKILVQRTCLISLTIFAVFSIYWGALYRIPARQLQGWIVDFDGGEVGDFFSSHLHNASTPLLRWDLRKPEDFPGGIEELRTAIINEDCWAVTLINANTTNQLNSAVLSSTTGYAASTAITVLLNEARNENAYRLVQPLINSTLESITFDFATKHISDLVAAGVRLETVAPNLLVRPAYYVVQNLRPFDVPVAAAVTFIGLIYLLILAFIVVNASTLARTMSGLEKRLTTSSLIRVRLFTPLVIYFVLSLMYASFNAAWKLPMDRRFGRAGFLIFWMLSYFGMSAAGLALEAMMTLMTIKYIQVFLLLWIIGNVSVCLWPIDMLPSIYNYGHGAPFWHISTAVRTIVFNTTDHVGQDFGVLTIWIVISACTLPLFQWYKRREELAAYRNTQKTRV